MEMSLSKNTKNPIDLAFSNDVTFGILAGKNKGSLTNIKIVNVKDKTFNEKALAKNKEYLHIITSMGYKYDSSDARDITIGGIVGKVERLEMFFRSARRLLAPGGQLLLDSSDISYVFMDEDGSMDIDLAAGYYGELDYRMQYRGIKGETFNWLYIDFDTLSYYAEQYGFRAELVCQGEHYDYLAKIFLKP